VDNVDTCNVDKNRLFATKLDATRLSVLKLLITVLKVTKEDAIIPVITTEEAAIALEAIARPTPLDIYIVEAVTELVRIVDPKKVDAYVLLERILDVIKSTE